MTTTPTRRRRRRRSTTTKTMLIALFFTALSLFVSTVPKRAEAIKHKKKDVVDASSAAAPAEEEPAQHQLDPALNTDEVRDAAKQVAHITDMDAYLAAIEHKMDVLAEHPAHNVRLFVCFLFFLSPLCFGKTGTRGRKGRIRGDDASPPVSLRRLFFRTIALLNAGEFDIRASSLGRSKLLSSSSSDRFKTGRAFYGRDQIFWFLPPTCQENHSRMD